MSASPGLVAVPALEIVFTRFAASLARLSQRLPPGSRISISVDGCYIDRKRNALVRDGLLSTPELQWVLFVDSDQDVPADTVDRLLAHEVAIVGAVYMWKDGSRSTARVFDDDAPLDYVPRDGRPVLTGASVAAGTGLYHCSAIGTGCLLVRREVFEALPEPWFEVSPQIGEDYQFCEKARAAGFPIYVDTGLLVGHLTTIAVTPLNFSTVYALQNESGAR